MESPYAVLAAAIVIVHLLFVVFVRVRRARPSGLLVTVRVSAPDAHVPPTRPLVSVNARSR
jgi:hypothetical protein